ncbi:MAG TPA: YcaO-like family protein [Streptosporangiaceae bacterium]|nr:YcaO-like family protein [Streptosporangiaceae bacterium]
MELAAAFGITRVHDLTPLGILGTPVWAAVTPGAPDLTQHLGRGHNHTTARASAVFEAVERRCAESPSASQVDGGQVSPATQEHTFREFHFSGVQMLYFSEMPWVAATNLVNGADTHLPLDLVRSPSSFNPDLGPRAWTTGLAVGTSRLECLWHGLCEVLERDMLATFEVVLLYGDKPEFKPISCVHLMDAALAAINRARELGMQVFLFAPDIPYGLHGAICYLADDSFPGAANTLFFAGSAVSYRWVDAADSAILEAFQAQTAMYLAARDSFEGVTDEELLPGPRRELDAIRRMWAGSVVECTHGHNDGGADTPPPYLDGIVRSTIEAARYSGSSSVYYCDLVLDDSYSLPLRVGRVIVPGLSAPLGATPFPLGIRACSALVMDS